MNTIPITTSVARRRAAAGVLVAAAVLFVTLAVRHARAAESEKATVAPGRAQLVVNLRDRLIVGLQARLKSEVAFVDQVVLKVQTGKLPQRIVDQTFFWARDRASIARNGSQRRPIIFFQPAMRARAARLRVVL